MVPWGDTAKAHFLDQTEDVFQWKPRERVVIRKGGNFHESMGVSEEFGSSQKCGPER